MQTRENSVKQRLAEMRDIIIHLTKNTDIVIRYLDRYKNILANRFQVTPDKFAVIIRAYNNVKKQYSLISALQMIDTQQSPEEVINHLYTIINEKEKDIICFFSALIHITKICDKYLSKLPDILKNNQSKFIEEAKEAFSNPDYLFAPVTLLIKLKELFTSIQELDGKDENVASLKRKVERWLDITEEYQDEDIDSLDEGQFAYLEKRVSDSIDDTPMRRGGFSMEARSEKEVKLKKNKTQYVLKELQQITDGFAEFVKDMEKVGDILFKNQRNIRIGLNKKLTEHYAQLTYKQQTKEVLSASEEQALGRLRVIREKNNFQTQISQADFSHVINIYSNIKSLLEQSDGILAVLRESLEKINNCADEKILEMLHQTFQQDNVVNFFFACLELTKVYDYYFYLLADVIDDVGNRLSLNTKQYNGITLEKFKLLCFKPVHFLPRFKLRIVSLVEAKLKDLSYDKPDETPIKINGHTTEPFFRLAFSIFRQLDRLMSFSVSYLDTPTLPLDSDDQKKNKHDMTVMLKDTQARETYGGNKAKLLRVKNGIDDEMMTICMYNEVSGELVYFYKTLDEMKENIMKIRERFDEYSPLKVTANDALELLGHSKKKGKKKLKPLRLKFEGADDEVDNSEMPDEKSKEIYNLFSDYLKEIGAAIEKNSTIPGIPCELLRAFANNDDFISAYNRLEHEVHTAASLDTFFEKFKPARDEYKKCEAGLLVETGLYNKTLEDFHRLQRAFTIDLVKYVYECLFSGNFFYMPKRPSNKVFTEHMEEYAKGEVDLDSKVIEAINNLPQTTKAEIESAIACIKELKKINFVAFLDKFIQQKNGNGVDGIINLNEFYEAALKPAIAAHFRKITENHLHAHIDKRPSQCGLTLFSYSAYQAILRQHRDHIDKYNPREAKM